MKVCMYYIAVGIVITTGVAFFVGWRPPTLIWVPKSDSIPPGIYIRTWPTLPLAISDIVVFQALRSSWPYLASLGIDGLHTPLMKQVGATSGYTACFARNRLTIDGAEAGEVLTDVQPLLVGCYRIPVGMFLPLSFYNPRSYDGRYFGFVPVTTVLAKVRPLLLFPAWLVRWLYD